MIFFAHKIISNDKRYIYFVNFISNINYYLEGKYLLVHIIKSKRQLGLLVKALPFFSLMPKFESSLLLFFFFFVLEIMVRLMRTVKAIRTLDNEKE